MWYTLVMLAISAAAMAVMSSLGSTVIHRDSQGRLTKSVEDTVRQITDPHGGMRRNIPDFEFFRGGVHCALYDSRNNVVGGHIPFDFADSIPLAEETNERRENGESYITYAKKISLGEDGDFWVKGVISVTDESRMLASAQKTNLMLSVVLIFTAALGGYFIVSRAFRPVSRITETAREISESQDLSQRIGLEEGGDEIHRLAATFDNMLTMLERTLENEKQFTSDASHELRTPVAVINSECEYALGFAKTLDEAKESVEAIKRQSDKMTELITQLLTISRMDRNTAAVSFEETDISELLTFVCDEQREIRTESICLEASIAPNIYADADRSLTARLFINLISNAYSYGKEGGHIFVNLSETDDSVVFSIEDDGIGISEENLPRIWERFYQVDPSRTNSSGSTGLGLSMVKWIAQRHGGEVTIESRLGVGTKATYVMPKKHNE